MPARLTKRKSCWTSLASKLPAPPLPRTDAQWVFLALVLTLATCAALAPSANLRADLVFVAPSRADLMLPARNPSAHLDRGYRRDVLDRLAALAPLHCGHGGESRSALFAQNFLLRDAAGAESPVDANAVHFCGNPGETMVALSFEPMPGASEVTCAEEYVDFAEKKRPSQGFLSYALVEDGYRRVRRAARNPGEACLAQHAVEILEATWHATRGL